MTTKPYSEDLRKKVVDYLKKGNTQKSASEIFNLHRNTISVWWLRYQKLGITKAKIRTGAKRKIDLQAFESYMQYNSATNIKELSIKFTIAPVEYIIG